jgi:hypothetical protein
MKYFSATGSWHSFFDSHNGSQLQLSHKHGLLEISMMEHSFFFTTCTVIHKLQMALVAVTTYNHTELTEAPCHRSFAVYIRK